MADGQTRDSASAFAAVSSQKAASNARGGLTPERRFDSSQTTH